MSEQDDLLRRLGKLAAAEDAAAEDADGAAFLTSLDALARERIVKDIVSHSPRETRASRRRRAVTIGGPVLGALALAAALSLLVGSRTSSIEPLPRYSMQASGASSLRANPDVATVEGCRLEAQETGSFEVVAKTDAAVRGEVVARAFVVRRGVPAPWPGDLETSAQGSTRVAGERATLLGASELRLVVGRPEALRGEAALEAARGSAESGSGFQVLRCVVVAR